MVGIVGLVGLALVLPAVQVCRDWAFIDQNTGSRKGYREWFFGVRTGVWYEETALETFMRTKQPGEFRQQWVSYAGTGRSIFGGATLHGHGRPGPVMSLKVELIDDYCARTSDSEKRQAYDVFAGGKLEEIERLVDDMFERVAGATPQVLETAQIENIWTALWESGGMASQRPELEPLSKSGVVEKMTGNWTVMFGVTPDRLAIELRTNGLVEVSGKKEGSPWKKTGHWQVVSDKLVLFLKEDSLPSFIFRTRGQNYIFDPWANTMMSELKREK
jgi:hypothetical protein